MDKNEILGATEVTEDDLVCHDCLWRGNQHGYNTTRCEMYEVKPFAILGGDRTTECESYRNEEEA